MTTKCSFSFRCTHAARHTPHTCQKSCREGGAEKEGDEREGGGRGGGVGSLWVENGGGSVGGMVGGGDKEKVGILGG